MIRIQREIRDIAKKSTSNPESISYARQVYDQGSIVKFSRFSPDGPLRSLRSSSALWSAPELHHHRVRGLSDSKEVG